MALKKKTQPVDLKGWAALAFAAGQFIEAHHREILEILSRLPHPIAEHAAPPKPARSRRLLEVLGLVVASGVGIGFALRRSQR